MHIYIYILYSRKTMEQQAPNRDKNRPRPRPSAIILEPRVFSTPILSRSGIIIETRAMAASPRRTASRRRCTAASMEKADRPCPTSARNEASPVCKWLHPSPLRNRNASYHHHRFQKLQQSRSKRFDAVAKLRREFRFSNFLFSFLLIIRLTLILHRFVKYICLGSARGSYRSRMDWFDSIFEMFLIILTDRISYKYWRVI